MALQQNNVTYLDDWKDLKEYTKKKAEAVEKEKDNRDVTKDYVGEQIDEYAQEDAAREASDISALYKKIEDISAGGGVDLTPYLKKDDAAQIYATKSEIPSVDDYVTQEQMTEELEDKATIAQVAAVDQKVDAIVIPDTSNFATKADVSALAEQIPSVDGFVTEEQMTSALEDKATIAQVAAVDQKINTIDSSLGEKATYAYVNEILTQLEENIGNALDEKADANDVSAAFESVETSIETKADAESVPTKIEFEVLKGKFEELKQLVYEYAPGSEQEAIADGKIADLSPDNKSVRVDEPMKSVVLPESTGTSYTVEVPLRDESSVELTSPKTATIANTSDEPVNTTFSAPEPTGSSNTKIYLSGLFEDIELTNVNIDKSKSYDAAIISGNVTITEANTNPVTVAAEFSNGCVITNDSSCNVTLNNKSAVGSSVTVLAPESTVTIQGGQWEEFASTVGEDTLYINKSAHVKKLIINKGNCVVNSYDVSNCVDEVVNETEYTVTPRVIEVTTKTEWTKASSTDALYEVQNDISTNLRIAPGMFGSQAKMKLNGHTVTCTDANGAFLLRGDSHYIVENGTIDASGYGVWLSGPGTVELKDLHIIADTHALYIEKTGGNIYTTGNCRFEVSNDDKRYVANYLDSTYTGGWTHGFHFGENTEFVDFDPAASMSEVGGPVNLLDEGYHTESYAEGDHTIYKVVKDNE